MKNHKEMMEALLAGETLVDRNYTCRLIDGSVKLFVNNGMDTREMLDEKDKCMWFGAVEQWTVQPKTININGFEVPEPLRVAPKINELYWCIEFYRNTKGVFSNYYTWDNDDEDQRLLSLGVIHKTKEAAELHAEALLSFTSVVPKESK